MFHRIDTIEGWLLRLSLPALSQQEALYLSSPMEKEKICDVFDDLVFICQKRYQNNYFWPDFAVLGLDCPLPPGPKNFRPRIFAIGVPARGICGGNAR